MITQRILKQFQPFKAWDSSTPISKQVKGFGAQFRQELIKLQQVQEQQNFQGQEHSQIFAQVQLQKRLWFPSDFYFRVYQSKALDLSFLSS